MNEIKPSQNKDPRVFSFLLATDENLKKNIEEILGKTHTNKETIANAVAYILEHRQPNNLPRVVWQLRLEYTVKNGVLYMAFRYLRHMPSPELIDTDGIHRFQLREHEFIVGSSLFREDLTEYQVIGPEPPPKVKTTPIGHAK